MIRFKKACLIGLGVLLFAGTAIAGEYGSAKGVPKYQDKLLKKVLKYAHKAEKLGLSEQEMAQVKAIRFDAERYAVKANADIHVTKLNIMEALEEPKPNFAKIDDLIGKKYMIKREKAKYLVRYYSELSQLVKEKKAAICKKGLKYVACASGARGPKFSARKKGLFCGACSGGSKGLFGAVINTEAMEILVAAKSAPYIFDARSGKWDDGKRIPGAKQMNADASKVEISQRIPSKNALVIVYCSSVKCPASARLAERLREYGYQNVLEYPEGIAGWLAADNDIEMA